MLRPVTDRATFVALSRAPAGRCGAVRVKVLPVGPALPRPGGCSGAGATAADAPQVAFALTRRVGGAVVRNRIRRRLRAVMRALAERDDAGRAPLARPGRAYLLSAGSEAASCPFPTLRGWVEGAVRRAEPVAAEVERAAEPRS